MVLGNFEEPKDQFEDSGSIYPTRKKRQERFGSLRMFIALPGLHSDSGY